MPVTEQTPIGSAVGNGVATVFPFDYYVSQAADLVVQIDGVPKVLNVDYTVSGIGNQQGGQIAFAVAPGVATSVTHFRDTSLDRSIDYQTTGDLFANTLDFDVDRLWLALQEIYSGGKGAPTAIRVPPGETVPPLPKATDRANRVIGFDSNGNPIAVLPTGGDATSLAIDLASSNSAAKGAGQIGFAYALAYGAGTLGRWLKDLAQSAGSSFIGFIRGGVGAVLRTVQDVLRERVSVKDYGAVGNGVANDAAAFQAAATYAATVGAAVFVPDGKYLINGIVTLPDKVSLWGNGKSTSELQFGPSGALRITGTNLGAGASGHLSIRGLGITNQGGGPTYALQLSYATRVLVSDCVIYNTSIQLSAFSYINIENCDMFGGKIVGDHPTVNEISEALKISRCNGSNFGIDIKDTADVHISLTHLLGPASQILIQRGEQNSSFYPPVQIANCIVDSGDDEGIYLIGVAPRVSDTFVSGGRTNLKSGVRLNDCVEGSLKGVTSRFCGNHGLHLGFSKQIKVLGCHFDDNKVSGIRLGDSSNITIIGNTAINQPSWFGGNYPQVNGIVDEPSNCTNITCVGNQVSGNTSTQIYLPAASNIIHSNSGYNEGRLTCDSWRPNTDNSASLGTSGARWSVVYAASGTINTSDEREKTSIEPLTEAHRRIALFLKGKIGVFRFKDAIEQKGEGARYHFGVGAQTVAAAFAAEGLDPHAYALFCFDEWPELPEMVVEHPEVPEVRDDDGKVVIEHQPARREVVQEGKPAGNRYGIRYDELAMFILAAI
ncbi:hypothetical protein CDN99_06685 [Roseateles aquatilis]|uniref:Peptidase S74 domain-containing protein n=1 Tax=Roseateles aquatilis TaxID=431061 RepID=A0A246JIG0_9BURK|nr:glycosyl hydrolase family 28-related protein [Roseateles aquatilis]OWQ92039.1 hypothetical protein CDN99_06685 [Roseateles aquatilis]